MSLWNELKRAVSPSNRSTNQQASRDPNLNGSLQFWTPGQPIWSEKDYRAFVRSGYRKNPTVYTCINMISGAAAGINWKLYTGRDMQGEIKSHPLLDLWRKPNSSMPGTGSFIEQAFGFWHMSGNSYIYAYRPAPTAPPLALWPLRPDRMKAVADDYGIHDYIYGYESDNPVIYSVQDTLHMKFPAYDDDVYGLSPIEIASYYSDQQNEAMGWNTSLMQNAGRPASVFMAKNYLSVEQRNQVREEIQRRYSGKRNAGRPLILEADFTWQNMALTPMEVDFLKSFELGTRQIAAIFNVAPELVGDAAGKTFANVDAARQALYLENVLPKLDRFADYLNSWLLPMYPDLIAQGAYFCYDREDIEALQSVYQTQADAKHSRARADWQAGGITLDEYREQMGLPPAKYGKVFLIDNVLIDQNDLKEYAASSMDGPAAPPLPIAIGSAQPGAPGALPGQAPTQPALPVGKKPGKQPATGTEPQQGMAQTGNKKPGKKSIATEEVYQPDDLKEHLAALTKDGATHLMWICDDNPCEMCAKNNGVTVRAGEPFPSGHILPGVHPHCECMVIPVSKPSTAKFDREMIDLLARKLAEYLGEKHDAPFEHILSTRVDEVRNTVSMRSLPVPAQEKQISAIEPEDAGIIVEFSAPTGNDRLSARTERQTYQSFLDSLL
jgi:HK97 family phage portal protein